MGMLAGLVSAPSSLFAAESKTPAHNAKTENASGAQADVEAGMAAVEKEDYATAYSIFLRLANEGNAEAQHNLAMLYRAGRGVKKDLAKSYEWFLAAAKQGIPDAQYYLGYMYDNGEFVEQNPKLAFEWYQKAAKQGNGLAQINLGVFYANGVSVPQDVEQAYLWFHVAAAQGYKAGFENRLAIENALKEQGDDGLKMLEQLKVKARAFFQQYIHPFEPPATPRKSDQRPKMGH